MNDTNAYWESLSGEIRGDASNFKGTDYHLLYAIWSLVTRHASQIHFFAGNDVLAHPCQPATTDSDRSFSSLAHAEVGEPNEDAWIQLKCTNTPWTKSELLSDVHLLSTFIINTFLSDARDRKWTVHLVSTAPIRSEEIRKFVSDPSAHPNTLKKFDASVDHASKLLESSGKIVPLTRIRSRGREILSALADCRLFSRDILLADIRSELTSILVDNHLAQRVFREIYGGILNLSTDTQSQVVILDLRWFKQATGHDLSRQRLLEKSLEQTCDQQIEDNLKHYKPELAVARESLTSTLSAFLTSDSSLFVLSGASGAGKSWALASWCAATKGQIRILVSGSSLRAESSLASIVANELRPFSSLASNDETFLKKFCAGKSVTGSPPVIIVDDLRPPSTNAEAFSRMIADLAKTAHRLSIKLIISCQREINEALQPFSTTEHHLRYSPVRPLTEPEGRVTPFTSVALSAFTRVEMEDALSRYKNVNCHAWLPRFNDPALSPLFSPQLLALFLESLTPEQKASPNALIDWELAHLIDHPAKTITRKVTEETGFVRDEVEEVLDSTLSFIWQHHGQSTSTHIRLSKHILDDFGPDGRQILDAYYRHGLFSKTSQLFFTERGVWARSMARHVHSCSTPLQEALSRLSPLADLDFVEQFIATSDSPLDLADAIIAESETWNTAIASGLVYTKADSPRTLALLTTLARTESQGES